MVQQNVCKSDFSFRGVKVCKNDSGIEERLIGWCKDSEWAVALKRFEQLCLNHAGHKGIVNSCALCRAWDVIGCLAWCEHLVNDMNDTVAGVDISKRDCGIVHHHAITNGEGDWVTVDGGCCQALCYCRRRNFSGDYVVEQNVSKCSFAFWGVKGG